jgi:hypothetical protein
MDKLTKITPTGMQLLAMVFVYIAIISAYGHYIVSNPMPILIQGAATFLILVYSWWLSHLFINFIKTKVK